MPSTTCRPLLIPDPHDGFFWSLIAFCAAYRVSLDWARNKNHKRERRTSRNLGLRLFLFFLFFFGLGRSSCCSPCRGPSYCSSRPTSRPNENKKRSRIHSRKSQYSAAKSGLDCNDAVSPRRVQEKEIQTKIGSHQTPIRRQLRSAESIFVENVDRPAEVGSPSYRQGLRIPRISFFFVCTSLLQISSSSSSSFLCTSCSSCSHAGS